MAELAAWLDWYARGFPDAGPRPANWLRVLREIAHAGLPVLVSVDFDAEGELLLFNHGEDLA